MEFLDHYSTRGLALRRGRGGCGTRSEGSEQTESQIQAGEMARMLWRVTYDQFHPDIPSESKDVSDKKLSWGLKNVQREPSWRFHKELVVVGCDIPSSEIGHELWD